MSSPTRSPSPQPSKRIVRERQDAQPSDAPPPPSLGRLLTSTQRNQARQTVAELGFGGVVPEFLSLHKNSSRVENLLLVGAATYEKLHQVSFALNFEFVFNISVKVTGQLSETKRLLAEREEELRIEKMKNKTLADGIKETLGTSENSPSPVKIPKLGEFDRGRTPATRASPRPSRSPSSGRRSTAADRTSRGRSVVPRSPRRRSRSRRPVRYRTRSRSRHTGSLDATAVMHPAKK